jgi:hypothetical protein
VSNGWETCRRIGKGKELIFVNHHLWRLLTDERLPKSGTKERA